MESSFRPIESTMCFVSSPFASPNGSKFIKISEALEPLEQGKSISRMSQHWHVHHVSINHRLLRFSASKLLDNFMQEHEMARMIY